MRRKRIKAAKQAKLAKIKQLQSQITNQKSETENENRLHNDETEDIDKTIKAGLKKVTKSLMKNDDRFKNVIGKITKIKRKADNVNAKNFTEENKLKRKKR